MDVVFGPVPSRSLGQSLGIDPIPLKTCNWNCVYCQLGRSVPLTNIIGEYIPRQVILDELKSALTSHPPGTIDWITFVGSGEPTLHSELGRLIHEIKSLSPIPVAVITNGATLYLPQVRAALLEADAVLPSLDAGNPTLYKKINRPHPEVTFERYIDGLMRFREEYQGQLWVEVMLIRGLNDGIDPLNEIAAVLRKVKADQVHLNFPTRPPAEEWVLPPDEEGVARAVSILGEIAIVVHDVNGVFDLSGHKSLEEAILAILTRHPMEEGQMQKALKESGVEGVDNTLSTLMITGKVQIVERYGRRFYSAASALYAHSQSAHPIERKE